MAERSMHSHALSSRKPMFCFFALVTILCAFSWFFFLGSTGQLHFIDHRLLPNSMFLSPIENQVYEPENVESIYPSYPAFSSFPDKSGIDDEVALQCDPNRIVLKVFMYDLPSEFHFELLNWKPTGAGVWPDISKEIPEYPGGLNLQHSIEYWLTLDLLSSRLPDRRGPCTAIRVQDSRDADVVFVPFFSSISFNRHSKIKPPNNVSTNKLLQDKLVQFLTSQEEWKRSGGHDHIIMAHHPNSMLDARVKLWPCMFIVADFGRYSPNVANVGKDVIAPYKHLIQTYANDSSTFDDRPTLLYFQGAIYRKDGGFIRQELFYLLKDEKDVHFSFGSIQGNGISLASRGMHSSKFCLNIAGLH